MPLSPGSKLGPYEIQSSLGAGGMGEVYSARDTRLDRTVAIKILPEHLSEKAEAHARFEREARAISSLNHSNICQLYDVGEQSGVRYIVMEHLQGETLADRLKKGPLSLDQLTRIGADIGDGLQCAHRSGIVHRDLKPGNIMLTKAGAKILDFGLAKGGSVTGSAHDLRSLSLRPLFPIRSPPRVRWSELFNICRPSKWKEKRRPPAATSLASAPCSTKWPPASAPSKAKARSPSRLPFSRKNLRRLPPFFPRHCPLSITSSAAASQKIPTPVGTVPATLRANSAGSAATAEALRTSLRSASHQSGAACANAWCGPPLLPPFSALSSGWRCVQRPQLQWFALRFFRRPIRFSISTGTSPVPRFFLPTARRSRSAHTLPKSENLSGFSLSIRTCPESLQAPRVRRFRSGRQTVYPSLFFADQKLKTIPVAGGPVSSVADAPNPRGGAWGADNTIVYTPDYRDALWIVHPHQADAKRLTRLDANVHSTHRWPSFLPDGKHFLFLATSHGGAATDKYGIYIGSTDGHQSGLVLSSDSAAQYAGGYLLFHRESQLMAQKLNWRDGTLSGTPMTLVDKVDHDAGTWHTTFTTSANGMLIFQAATVKTGYDFMWLDRKGNIVGKAAESLAYNGERISPDGKRVAVALGDPKPDIWIFDFVRGSRTRLTFDAGIHSMPSWSGDGQRVLYVTQMGMNVATGSSIRAKQSSGTGQEEIILDGGTAPGGPFSYLFPQWTPDGKYLAYQKQNGPLNSTFWAQSTTGDQKPFLVLQPQSPQGRVIQTRLSPDGHWLAYTSTDSGREDVYVTTFPTASGRWQISQGGGGYPFWRGDGKELYFAGLSDATAYAVALKINGDQLEAGIPQPLFVVRNTSSVGTLFDVAPDGQRFLVPLTQKENADVPMSLVVNWPALLNK